MIKVSVMYPQSPGTRFDHDYYREKHLPLIKRSMGAGLKYYTIDKELAAGAPYVAMCHLMCDSLESYQSSMGPHAAEIKADIPKFTDRTPVTQISQIVVENSAEALQTVSTEHYKP
jgi:uncharacterized protein (TIGR02118 family)